MTDATTPPTTKGRVLHSAAGYDVLAWLLTRGRERPFRKRLVELARVSPGEVVLDVGCGTGSLAIAAREAVGETGSVSGIDASPSMIERARRKAKRAGVDVTFDVGVVEALPYSDRSFDVVLGTLMLHHLPAPARQQCIREVRRVLKPGGRMLAVDFETPAKKRGGLLVWLHHHGHFSLRKVLDLLSGEGFAIVERGSVGVRDLHFALAKRPHSDAERSMDPREAVVRALDPLPANRGWILPAVVVAVLLGHGLILRAVASQLALSATIVAAIAVIVVVMHLARRLHG